MMAAPTSGQRLALWAMAVATTATVGLMTLVEHFRIVLSLTAVQADSATMAIMAVLGEIVLVSVTVIIATIVAQLAFGQAVDELRQQIALRRLVGARRGPERRRLVLRCIATGVLGALIGLVVGMLAAAGVTVALSATLTSWAQAPLPPVQPVAALPAAGIAAGAAVAAWIASRRVLDVAPLEALASSRTDTDFAHPARHRAGKVLVLIGCGILATGCALGFLTPLAVLVGVVGGVVSVIGIVALSTPMTSRMLAVIRRPLRATAVGRTALGSLERSPHRFGGITVALMVGIASVTMFAVAGATAEQALLRMVADADLYDYQREALAEMTTQLMTVVSLAVGSGSVVAVFGFIATMLMSVRARTREIGLLRLVGMRAGQARSMVVIESAVIAALALTGGLIIGAVYGWLGTFMMLGSVYDIGPILPAAPWALLPVLALATAAVAAATAIPAARRASAVPPLAAVRSS